MIDNKYFFVQLLSLIQRILKMTIFEYNKSNVQMNVNICPIIVIVLVSLISISLYDLFILELSL